MDLRWAEIRDGSGEVIVTAIEDETGLESDWSVRAHAICASP
jgi:hypothetical protein